MSDCVECKEITEYTGMVDVVEHPEEPDPRGDDITRWSGMIAPWEIATGDRRTFARDSLEHRELPLPLKWQRSDNGGHTTSITVGTIQGIEYREDGAYAWGLLLDPDPAQMPRLAEDVAELRLLLEQRAVSPSVDLAAMQAEALDPDGQYAATGQRPDVRVMQGEIGAVTLVPVAAFKEVRPFALDKIPYSDYESLVASARAAVPIRRDWSDVPVAFLPWDAGAWLEAELSGESMTASALYQGYGGESLFPVGQFVDGTLHLIPGAVADAVAVFAAYEDVLPFDAEERDVMRGALVGLAERCDLPVPPWAVTEGESLVASAVPLAPPDDWFDVPEPDHVQALTVTADGRVFGHIADNNTCHVGFPGKCRKAPKSMTNYALAHTGAVLTASGRSLDVGRITLGGGHADTRFGVRPAQEHYDNAATCVARGVFRDGRHGIWFSGAAVPEATEHQLAQLRLHPPSGDWRNHRGHPELILAHAVNTGGFPIARYRMEGDQVVSLVAAGALHPDSALDAAVNVFALAAAAAVFTK